ncbi:MAG: ArsJ-associated glyceraldehyde-3-phosphate dehydrogenase [Colwellia sp.]|nr:ArsJ-associated glyceraldehyde-3-phosphate dehydrogenase [Colwellia sp.]
MKIKVGINGFGRMGRLSMRVALEQANIDIVQINDPAGDAKTHAHLLEFDSVHGRCSHAIQCDELNIIVNGKKVAVTNNSAINDTDWSQCDVVIEASGKMKTAQKLQAYLEQGVKRIVVTAPIAKKDMDDTDILNIVMGVNQHLYQGNKNSDKHRIVTAASCTTNCLAPVVKVIHENIGIKHGSMTTIHDITNTQTIIDAPHKDLRRARSCGTSLIPTTTGSAKAITSIFPELTGKLNGHAVRIPLTNASLTDCVFELNRATTVEEVNILFKQASQNELQDILGYEERPLVSIDYKTDPRSSIIDALSTMVINGTQLKLYAWYDNEWGYVNRTIELVQLVGMSDQ